MCRKLFSLMFVVLLAALAGNASATVGIDDFESYTDTADLRTTWYTFGTWGTTIFDRYLDTAGGAGSSQAMRIDSSYDGDPEGFGGWVKRSLANADWSAENGIRLWQKGSVSGSLSLSDVVYRVWFHETDGDWWRTNGAIPLDDATYGGGAGGGYVILPFAGGTSWSWQDYGGSGANDDGVMQLDSIDEFQISVFAWSTTSGDSYSMWVDDFEANDIPTSVATGMLSGRVHQIDDFESYIDTADLQAIKSWQWTYVPEGSGASIANYLESGTNKKMRVEYTFPAGSTDIFGVVGVPTLWNWEGRTGIQFWVKASTTGDTPQYYHVRFHEGEDGGAAWGDKWRSPWMPISDLDPAGQYVFLPFDQFIRYGGAGGAKDDGVRQLDEIGNFYVGANYVGTSSNGGTTTLWVDDIVAISPRDTVLAWDPIPNNIAAGISPSVVLSWLPGDYAVSHDVYFGTTNPPPFVQNQTATTYDPGTLTDGTVYYWRIDEVNDSNSSSPWTGEVWDFKTSQYNEITFFITSDLHYGVGFGLLNRNESVADGLNTLPGTVYPSSVGGGTVDRPRGVFSTGDLTENSGVTSQWNSYINDYGVFNGEGRINFPVYEGYGNHDMGSGNVIKEGIKDRNTQRATNVNVSSNGLHYSWDWDAVHFVNLNICPGSSVTTWANDSLVFLQDDLTANVGDSNRAVVILYHYGFGATDRWIQDEQNAFYDVIVPYNIIAIFHGHSHTTHYDSWNANGRGTETFDAFDTGSTGLHSKSLAVRISDVDDTLTVVSRTGGAWTTTIEFSEAITFGDVDDTTPPSPDPMTWATIPYATGETSISMTATTASDVSGVEYYFDETSGNPGGTDSGWQDSTTYEDTGLDPGTQYTYRVQARDKSINQNTTGWSTTESATTDAGDTTPPSPDPMTWATVPYATGSTSISMTATTASDVSGVEYYFDETSGNPGGADSGWQDSTTYEDTGLDPSTAYTYRVQARDKSTNQNATGWSSSESATTDAGGSVTLLEDGFEVDFSKWTDGGTTDWDRTTSQKYSGSYSAHAGSSDNDLISDNLNTTNYSSITIVFWYRDDDIDDNDNVYLQLYDGSGYDNKFELGNTSPEDTWHKYETTINNSGGDAQYFHSTFRIKFEGTSIDRRENLWIDDVLITAE